MRDMEDAHTRDQDREGKKEYDDQATGNFAGNFAWTHGCEKSSQNTVSCLVGTNFVAAK